MKGKDKCKLLKEIRAQIAAANEIEWVTENCSHKGECRGTCPKCESEVAALERALDRRRALGKTVAVVGLSAGIVVSSAACGLGEPDAALQGDQTIPESTAPQSVTYELDGMMKIPKSGTEAVDGEMVELDGDIAPVYYSSDFTPCPKYFYRATELIYPYALDDADYSEWTVWEIAAGDEFTVIGESVSLEMVLIDFHGQKFALYIDYLYFADLIGSEKAL